MAARKQFSTFYVDAVFFGVEVEKVQEVLRYQEMTAVPLAPPMIGGLINLRGHIVTAVDLRRLGFPERPSGQLPMNVVVRTDDGAVKIAETTNATVAKLGESSAEIGQVIKVITSIAQQTNLLALNGTIEAARAGRYTQLEVNRGMPASMLVRHSKKTGIEWQISDEIRKQVDYREMNLIDAWPVLPLMDIVFLRNVLIYFDIETKKSILGRVRRLLQPDGHLLLGGAETTMGIDDGYDRLDLGRAGVYRLRGKAHPLASR